jgi:Flp pilus assembly protein protease CpaA
MSRQSMKEDWRWVPSLIEFIVSAVTLLLVYASESTLPNYLVVVLLLVFFITAAVAGFSMRTHPQTQSSRVLSEGR